MNLGGRILRYFLEVLAISSVLLVPAGCDPAAATLPSQVGDDGAGGDLANDDSGGDASDNDGVPAGPGVAEVPGEGDGDVDPGDEGADPTVPVDDAADGDTPDNPGDDGQVPDDGGADDPLDEPGDDDPPPDDFGGDDPPTDDGGDDDPPPDDGGGDDPPPDDDGGDDAPPDDDGGGEPADDPEVPNNEYCDPVANWPDAWRAYEQEVLTLVNERRAAGANCGAYGSFAPAGPLSFEPALRCAARAHSMDMGVRDFFSHTNPDGDGPGQRLSYAGYAGFGWGENIAWGYMTPAAVVAGWMNSPGHCANIMRTQWTLIGIGYYEGNIWTQTFGAN